VDEGPLGVHEVELMVEPGPGLRDGGGVRQHADAPRHLGQVAAGDDGGRLVVDADLEAGGAPVHELDGPLGLDVGDGGVDVLGHHVPAVQHAARHVLPCINYTRKNVKGEIGCKAMHEERLSYKLVRFLDLQYIQIHIANTRHSIPSKFPHI